MLLRCSRYPEWAALAAGLWLVAGAAFCETAEVPAPAWFDQDGLRVEMEIAPLGGASGGPVRELEEVELRFRVREAVEAGGPIAGLDPLAWLNQRREGQPLPGREACKFEIRGLLAGRLARVADVNLNEYLVVTLDENNSVSIIDPQIESSKTKTLGMVALTAKGTDFVLAPDRRNALVTLPTQGRVAAADLFLRKARYLDLGGSPRRIVLQPDGRLAWVGDAARATVSAIDPGKLELAGTVPAGPGPHEIAFRRDSRYAYVVSPAATALSVIDTHQLERVAEVEIGPGAIAVGYSAHSEAVYIALRQGTVEVVDAQRHQHQAKISLPAAVTDFGISPDGRFAFALHRQADRLTIVETATNRVAHSLPTDRAPEHLDFTESFAYVRHGATADALLVDLSSLARAGEPLLAPVVMGQRSPPSGDDAPISPSVAPLPEGGGALVLNASDRSIYHFMEGMNAPMGAYQTYPWPARGILISDRTIREVQEGVYQTEFRLPRAGTYTLSFLVATSPQLFGCFTLEVEPRPGQHQQRLLNVESTFGEHLFSPGTEEPLRIRLSDPQTGLPVADLEDVMILVMRLPKWQWRGAARSLGDGRYEVTVVLPESGWYQVMVKSFSRGIEFGQLRTLYARAGEPAEAMTAASRHRR